jgi:P4 family phage/plasmid primase-like protien
MARYDIDLVKSAAEGRWQEIITSIVNVDANILDGSHHACPKQCAPDAGGKDRFRALDDFESTGGVFCNQCFSTKNRSGFDALMWLLNEDFSTVLAKVAKHLGIKPIKGRKKASPTDHLEFLTWNRTLVGLWCLTKPPIAIETVQRLGWRVAKYRKQYTVIAIPIWGPALDAEEPVGWIIYRADGKQLPKYVKKDDQPEWVKVKITAGSQQGLIADLAKWKNPDVKQWGKVEGPSDLGAIESTFNDETRGWFTTANGSKEKPLDWIVERLNGCKAVVIHDCDQPGQEGATWVEQSDRKRAGWCPVIAEVAEEVRNIVLPFTIEPTHGNDLRDYFSGGATQRDLVELIDKSPIWVRSAESTIVNSHSYSTNLLDDSGKTDNANSDRFVTMFGDRLRYCPEWKSWLVWDGKRWSRESNHSAAHYGKRYAKSLFMDIAKLYENKVDDSKIRSVANFVVKSNNANSIASFLKLAESDERILCKAEKFNRHPNLLNCKNGTIDLENLEPQLIREHSPDDLLTQIADVEFDANALCPKWQETLDIIFDGNEPLIDYVQTILGYSLSGRCTESILPIAWGSGANGKSTIWLTVSKILGDYSYIANQDLLLQTKHTQHPAEKAALYGKRFVPVSEPDQGRRLNESKIKELTGTDTINARDFFESYFNFEPTHTFWLSTNHKPVVRGTDTGIWRRLKLIPFVVDIRTKVKAVNGDMARWLYQNEGPGILNWLIAGYWNWTQRGFQEPPEVSAATDKYRHDEDDYEAFIAENCRLEAGLACSANELFEAYHSNNGSMTKTAFGKRLSTQFASEKMTSGPYRNKKVYFGISLLS